MASIFETSVEFLKGVGPQKAQLLQLELQLFTYGDLLSHFPFRHEDRTAFHQIQSLQDTGAAVQVKGRLRTLYKSGEGRKERLQGELVDGTGTLSLTWFQGVSFLEKQLHIGGEYIVYGKPAVFQGNFQMTHPEMDVLTPLNENRGYFQAIYPLTEKLKKRYVDSKQMSKWIRTVLEQTHGQIQETLPPSLCQRFRLLPKADALWQIHFPTQPEGLKQALRRLKFEELFYNQFRLISQKIGRQEKYPGQIFPHTRILTDFYENHLPFDLTNAQKRVVKEVFHDLRTGKQMNRLVQGDVGSGKTIVAFICILLAIDNDAQACLMAPTEILADQHYRGLDQFASLLGLKVARLTGSTKKKERQMIHEGLLDGSIHLIVGTHALLEDIVQFKNLGLVIIDEQHRFGVAQRAKLWGKNKVCPPHILVMTATPIPRTLALTLYGDLDLSVIDELPKGRKPIKTVHQYDADRLKVFEFLRHEIAKERQIYIVYPLIEESEQLDHKNLMDGYESISRAFPECALSIVHGKMKSADKAFEMDRFKRGETQIMVATTVIEVGVDVPNASVMVIENAERFGLSQLHQLRGRVGRGAEQSYCILMSDYKLSHDTRQRLQTMVATNDGFEIAEADLRLRGPGDMAGTQQSGLLDLKIADLAKDSEMLKYAREAAYAILEEDPSLDMEDNRPIRQHMAKINATDLNWSRIS